MTINGEKFTQDSLPLLDYLKQRDLQITHIAIELNGKIVPKDELATLVFKQGDVVEIVSFVGGG
ncbi:sulfur carrier protein ThiS [Helicobacter canis]|uniref:Sulfur carrier protein ThiS n=1 Tax=Helicobacter canis TaxID=29419 RepID=A0A5M9QJX5_9HELI|nr:sulfur carrier protein ThiS [Helicobacter canis]KAA8708510.1 sulfur carrier protein ThiS [Helicobacter canis]